MDTLEEKIAKFRKKPVVVEAVQFWLSNYQLLWDFMGKQPKIDTEKRLLYIRTLENKAGEQVADEGDWIIKGVKGELYPCKPDVFEKTYEPVSLITESPKELEDCKLTTVEQLKPFHFSQKASCGEVTVTEEAWDIIGLQKALLSKLLAYIQSREEQARKEVIGLLKKQGAIWVDKNYAIIETIEKMGKLSSQK